jgi:hypothetical protein
MIQCPECGSFAVHYEHNDADGRQIWRCWHLVDETTGARCGHEFAVNTPVIETTFSEFEKLTALPIKGQPIEEPSDE